MWPALLLARLGHVYTLPGASVSSSVKWDPLSRKGSVICAKKAPGGTNCPPFPCVQLCGVPADLDPAAPWGPQKMGARDF
jgi:hypothetical protein